MKTKLWIVIAAIILISLVALTSLVIFTPKPNSQKNGFIRNISNNKVKLLRKKSSPNPFNRIVGYNNKFIHLIEKEANKITTYDWTLGLHDTVTFSRPFTLNVLANYQFEIDSPHIDIYVGNLSAKLLFSWNDTGFQTVPFNAPLFTKAAALNKQTVVLRAFDSARHTQFFTIADSKTGNTLRMEKVIQNQDDAGFSTDGWLMYDSISNRIIYLSIFENSFYCLDTTLKKIYIGRTIDTTNNNPVKTQEIYKTAKGSGSLKPSNPLRIINRDCCISDGLLFVLSTLKSDNESNEEFNANTTVDTYDIYTGKYIESFYIPKIDQESAIYIRVIENRLVALYKSNIAIYQIN